jgi:hypothetical protein
LKQFDNEYTQLEKKLLALGRSGKITGKIFKLLKAFSY